MEQKDKTIQIKTLGQNVQYYNNVFKKVEKISSVVFYVLSFKKDKDRTNIVLESLHQKSFTVHELSLKTLQAVSDSDRTLSNLQQALLSLMSSLQIASTARLLPAEIVSVVIEQIDAVQRYLTNHHLQTTGVSIADLHTVAVEAAESVAPKSSSKRASSPRRSGRVSIPQGDISTDAYLVYSQLNDRAERIKTVLEAKPEATVKDIAQVITDVSEKTIQRELNSLIEKGQVVREGERRWSRYSVKKD